MLPTPVQCLNTLADFGIGQAAAVALAVDGVGESLLLAGEATGHDRDSIHVAGEGAGIARVAVHQRVELFAWLTLLPDGQRESFVVAEETHVVEDRLALLFPGRKERAEGRAQHDQIQWQIHFPSCSSRKALYS